MKSVITLVCTLSICTLFSFGGCTEDKDPAACNPTLREITEVDWLANIQSYNYQGVVTHNITRSTLGTDVFFIHTRVRPSAFLDANPSNEQGFALAPAVQTTYYDCMGTLIEKTNKLNYTKLMLSADLDVMYQNNSVGDLNVNVCETEYDNISDAKFLFDIVYANKYHANTDLGMTLKIQSLNRVSFENNVYYVARFLDMNPESDCGHGTDTYQVYTCNGLFYGDYDCSAGTGPGNVGDIVNSSAILIELL